MASVSILQIDADLSMETKENLMKATPNVTTLLIQEKGAPWTDQRVTIDFGAIQNNLPKIESLGWLINRLTHHDLLHSLDAAITGLPVNFCVKNSAKFRKKDRLSADELRCVHQSQPRNSSILDLKGNEVTSNDTSI